MFSENLKKYLDVIGCTNAELSAASGLSLKTIARYKSGERTPQKNSEQIDKLSKGIYITAQSNNIDLNEDTIRETLNSSINTKTNFDYDSFLYKMNQLLDILEISNVSLAKNMKYDTSYISRIKAGSRKPADIFKFVEDIAMIFAKKAINENLVSDIIPVIGQNAEELDNQFKCSKIIKNWLVSGASFHSEDPFKKFLQSLDNFDLEEYIKVISFDKMTVCAITFQLPSSKKYFGIEQMREAELDFIKATMTSDSMEDIIMYSEMPMAEMAQDQEFSKKWMYGTAMMLKKGLHLNMIHNLNRPFNEMLLGLESWVPMYMTGQISPYYIKEVNGSSLLSQIKVSGAAALWGDAIAGHLNEGRYCLYKNKDDMQYYRKKAEQLLKTAYPLMEIYNAAKRSEFYIFLNSSYSTSGERKNIFGCLPGFTISDELARSMLKRNSTNEESIDTILRFLDHSRKLTETLLRENKVSLIIPKFTEEDFQKAPPTLFIPELFLDRDIEYTYEEYMKHLQLTQQFVETHSNCSLTINEYLSFRNINITIVKDKQVIVSKNKSPTIHFVIKHPRIIEAFEKFSAPIVD